MTGVILRKTLVISVMGVLKSTLFALVSLFIITACATTEWKPTAFYSQDNLQTTTPSPGEHIVVIYTTEWCYWCKIAKKWMVKHSIAYVEQNLKDPGAKERLKKFADSIEYTERLNSVPIFAINKKIYIGYNPEKILDAIGRRKSSTNLYTTWETPLK
tara:strand:- start:76 stop:549 length:474 start_codon:yes stop_codon:yes gene_type:complete